MGKSANQKIEVTDYRMSSHWGICTGPVDSLNAVYVGEKLALETGATAPSVLQINVPDLFGGRKKEGGVAGSMMWLPGLANQLLPSFLAARLGLTPSTAPGYRGIASAWFYNGDGGFLWATNNPYLRSIWFGVTRTPKVLANDLRAVGQGGHVTVRTDFDNVYVTSGGTIAGAVVTQGVATTINGIAIRLEGMTLTIDGTEIITNVDAGTITIDGVEYDITGSGIYIAGLGIGIDVDDSYVSGGVRISNVRVGLNHNGVDANPAAIIYECLVDRDWGMGQAPTMINTASFTQAARQLLAERFGLSLQWTRQSTVESFVSEVLDHIQATIFVNPRDGLLTLKLIRNDYDPDALPVLTPDNSTITEFDRKGWGETTNEIQVTWTNPINEQEETVTAQDLANIVIQGAVISDSRNYYGVRNRALAMKLARRDLAAASAPIATFGIEVDRSAWNFVPGGCARLEYPEHGISGVVVRIAKIEYGKAGSPSIKLSTSEDIFSTPQAAYATPSDTAWVNPSRPPEPFSHIRIMTAPSFFASSALRAADASALDYPEVMASILAASDIDDTYGYELFGTTTEPNGAVTAISRGSKPLLGFTTLNVPFSAEASTNVASFGQILNGVGPRPGGFVFIGDVAEGGHEIALIADQDVWGVWHLNRGVLDTVPRAWPTGTSIWFVASDSNFIDLNTIHSAAETVTYKLLPQTSQGKLSLDEAVVSGGIMTGRPYLPSRPAAVTVAGVAFGSVDLSASPPSSVPVTWVNRNRLNEDSQVLAWTDASATPEAGQTTLIRLLTGTGSVIAEHAGLTGTSFSVPIASFGSFAVVDVRVLSVRDGRESLQGHTIRVKLRPFGYGDNYGNNYGSVAADPGSPDPGSGEEYEPDPDYEFPAEPPWRDPKNPNA